MLVTVRYYSLASDGLNQLTIYMVETARGAVALCKRLTQNDNSLRAVAMARNGHVLCDLGRMAQHDKNRKQLRRIHTGSGRGAKTRIPNAALH